MRPFTTIALASLLSTAVYAQGTNVVQNGSFEQNRCSSRVGFGCMPGWTAAPQSASNIVWIRSKASDGKVAVEFDADDAPIYLSQKIQVLPKLRYTLQFDMAGQTRAPATIAMRVQVNGVTYNVNVPGSSSYKTYSFQFTPATTSTEIRFWNATQTNFPVPGALLDDVRVFGPAGKLETFGSGCSTAKLALSGQPLLGKDFQVDLTGGRARTVGILFVGGSRMNWGPILLPWKLDIFGARGCSLLTSIDLQLITTTDTSGNASIRLRVPNSISLAGARFFEQWSVVDRQVNALGLYFSNGGATTVGL